MYYAYNSTKLLIIYSFQLLDLFAEMKNTIQYTSQNVEKIWVATWLKWYKMYHHLPIINQNTFILLQIYRSYHVILSTHVNNIQLKPIEFYNLSLLALYISLVSYVFLWQEWDCPLDIKLGWSIYMFHIKLGIDTVLLTPSLYHYVIY